MTKPVSGFISKNMKEAIYILIILVLGVLLALQIYLFVILARLNESLKKINNFIDSLNAELPEIFENLKTITLRAKLISNELEKGVKQVSKTMSIFVPISSLLKLFFGLFKKQKEEN